MEDRQFMTALRAQDRWAKKDVGVAEFEAHVMCMSKSFRKYYANVFVLNKVSSFILDGSQNTALVLQGYHPAKEQRTTLKRRDAKKGTRSPTIEVWLQRP